MDPPTRRDWFVRRTALRRWVGAFAGDELVGFAGIDVAARNAAQLASLYTKPSWRRRGVAKYLIDALISESSKQSFDTCAVFVREENRDAHDFYRTLGGKPVGHFGLIWE